MDLEKLEYEKLSDRDLIQCFCTDPPDREAFDQLWRRYEQRIRNYAGCLMTMCPDSYSREIFFEEVFSLTQEKVVQRVCGFEGRATFSTWLWRIIKCNAIDNRRKIQGRGRDRRIFVPMTEEERAKGYAVFRDKLRQNPFHRAAVRERKAIMKEVLRRYAGSKEGYESLLAVSLYAVDECRVSEIATQLGTYERKIYRMLEHDYPALRASFMKAGVRSLLEI
jgi:RNA polymerase sigma factor (sigma-70 family)